METILNLVKLERRGGGWGSAPSGNTVSARQNKYFWRLPDSKMVSENAPNVSSLNKTTTPSARKAFGTTHVMISAFGSFETTHQKHHFAQTEMCKMDFWRTQPPRALRRYECKSLSALGPMHWKLGSLCHGILCLGIKDSPYPRHWAHVRTCCVSHCKPL